MSRDSEKKLGVDFREKTLKFIDDLRQPTSSLVIICGTVYFKSQLNAQLKTKSIVMTHMFYNQIV